MKKNDFGLHLEWAPTRCQGNWLDTFVHRVSATDGLPPAAQAKIIEEIARRLGRVRGTASLQVFVDSPGKWFFEELKRVCNPAIPVVIMQEGNTFETQRSLGGSPTLWRSLEPPVFKLMEVNSIRTLKIKDRSKLHVLRIMARLEQAHSIELASLSGYSKVYILDLMKGMAAENLVLRSTVGNHDGWEITRKGISIVHQSWNMPTKMWFAKERREAGYGGWGHRRASRMWPEWLKKSWGSAVELWDCWTEIYLRPDCYPDALAWGKFDGVEILYWLEVDTGHTGTKTILRKYQQRWQNAARYAKMAGLKMIFVLLAPPWVASRSRDAFVGLPADLAVITHEWGDFGTLPYPRFGWWTSEFLKYGVNEPYKSKRRKGNQLPFNPNDYR